MIDATRPIRTALAVAALPIAASLFSAHADDSVPIAHWDTAAGQPGLDNIVRDLASFQGHLYAAGTFTAAGDVTLKGIARWDPLSQTWSDVGGGLSEGGSIRALAVFDDGTGNGPSMYAGGMFDSIGGVAAKNLAKWDGVQWSPVITDMSAPDFGSSILALRVVEDVLYVGGMFDFIEGVAVNNIARFDPNAERDGMEPWQPLGAGLYAIYGWGEVYTIEHFEDGGPGSGTGHGPVIYAGGYFSIDGGYSSNKSFARFNPQGQTWSAPNVYMKFVDAMATFQGPHDEKPALYIGGEFSFGADGVYVSAIGKWDGEKWLPMPGVWIQDMPYPWVKALRSITIEGPDGDNRSMLLVGGNFEGAGPLYYVGGMAAWDGIKWHRLGSGVSPIWSHGDVRAFAPIEDASGGGSAVAVAGRFKWVDGQPVGNIATLDITTVAHEPCSEKLLATLEPMGSWSAAFSTPAGDELLVMHPDEAAFLVYKRGATMAEWSHVQTISNPAVAGGSIGSRFAVDGGTLIFQGQAQQQSPSTTDTFIFEKQTSGEWQYSATIPDTGGGWLWLDGDWLMHQKWFTPTQTEVYKRSGTQWLHDQTIEAAGQISFDGDRFLMGAMGMAVIYQLNGGLWTPLDELVFEHGGDQATGGVVLSGDRAFVSQPKATHSGVIHVFENDGEAWNHTSKIYTPDHPQSVALHGDRLFVSAGTLAYGIGMPFSTFVYERVGPNWVKRNWFSKGKVTSVAGTLAALIDAGDTGWGNPGKARIVDVADCINASVVAGDLNGDGAVGVGDLLILLTAWGACDQCDDCPADLNSDCNVGVPDLLILLSNWSES